MLLRRDGSVDFRVLAVRLGWYVGATTLAAGFGVLVALLGS